MKDSASQVNALVCCRLPVVQSVVKQTAKAVRHSVWTYGCMDMMIPDVQQAQKGVDDRSCLNSWHLVVLKGGLESRKHVGCSPAIFKGARLQYKHVTASDFNEV